MSVPVFKWDFIQSVDSVNTGLATVATTTKNVTAGNVIFVAVTLGFGASGTTVTDSQGNTYKKIATSGSLLLWWTQASATGRLSVTSHTIVGASQSLAILEFAAPPGSIITAEHTQKGTGSGTAVALPAIAATMPDVVIMACNQFFSSGTTMSGLGFTARVNQRSVFGTPGIFVQDNLNPASSPVPSTLTLGAVAGWNAASVALLATLAPYILIGPTGVANGSPAVFSLVPTGAILSDTITFDDGGKGGVFSPPSLTISASDAAPGFIYTPSMPGPIVITLTSTAGNKIGGSPFTLGSFTSFTLDGSPTGFVGVSLTLTLTPAETTTDTVTLTCATGSFDGPATWSNSSTADTVRFTPSVAGPLLITATSANGGPITGSPFSLTSVAVVIDPWLGKSRKALIFKTSGSSGAINGIYPLPKITAVNSDPTVKVQGNIIAISPKMWVDRSKNRPCVSYLALCGSVESCPMANGGVVTGALSAIWDGVSGGGKGLVLGTPTTQVGVTSYTIIDPGSGLTNGSYYVPLKAPFGSIGGNPTGDTATAYVTVLGGKIVSAVPPSGSPHACGGGYTGSFSSTSWVPGGLFPAGDGHGTGGVLQCNVTKYVTGIPIIDGGSDFISPPEILVSGATGAVTAPIMTGPLASDTITYSWAIGGITTDLGSTAAVIDVPITNYGGVLEGPVGNSIGFTGAPTLKVGGNVQTSVDPLTMSVNVLKNKYHANRGWTRGSAKSLTLDPVTYYPVSWTPGGTIYTVVGVQFYDGCPAVPVGVYTLVFDDQFYALASGLPGPTLMSLVASTGCTVTPGPRTVSGTTVTQPFTVALTSTYSTNMLINLTAKAPADGLWHVSNIGIFTPGNTIDRTPFAIDDVYATNLTGPTGTTPAVFRMMPSFGGISGWNNIVDASDIPPSTLSSYLVPYVLTPPASTPNAGGNLSSGTFAIASVRAVSTDGSKPWVSTKLYSGSLTTQAPWAVSGIDDILGSYLDMTSGPLGVNDNGTIAICNAGGPTQAVMEFTTVIEHGLKTGHWIQLNGKAPVVPFSGAGLIPIPLIGLGILFPVLVTGPRSFIINHGLMPNIGNATQTITSSTEIPALGMTGVLKCPLEATFTPYEAFFSFVNRFSGSIAWLTVTPIMTHACIAHIMGLANQYLDSTHQIYIESGNEAFNNGGSAGCYGAWGGIEVRFSRYAPKGQPFLTYLHGGDNPSVSSVFLPIACADLVNAAKTAWTGLGRLASDITPVYGGQQGAPGPLTTSLKAAVKAWNLPTGSSCIGAYYNMDLNQPSITYALSAAGDVKTGGGGNWPVDAYLDFYRANMFYNVDMWNNYSGNAAQLPAGFTTSVYECALTSVVDVKNVFGGDFLEEDISYHPAWADAQWCFYLLNQIGDPRVPGSAPALINYFTLYNILNGRSVTGTTGLGGDACFWRIARCPYSPTGPGTSNSFLTPQGGVKGSDGSHYLGYSQINDAPGIKALVDWNAAVAVTTEPPSVLDIAPEIDEVNVDTHAPIVIVFNKPMDPTSLNTSTITLQTLGNQVDGVIMYDATKNKAVFTPSAILTHGTLYTVNVKSVKSTYGIPIISEFDWMFQTN